MPLEKVKSIAVIGSGISGLSAAWHLSSDCSVTLYEKDDRLGGHSNTVSTPDGPVDTGFIVFNDRNYPNLVAFFDHLDVRSRPADMSFGLSLDQGELEYAGRDLAGLFAQPTNILRPSFLGMVADILRFYRDAPLDAQNEKWRDKTLGDYLQGKPYGQFFIENHIIPMGAAIWSSPAADMLNYPLQAFIRFCDNHGLLQIKDRPQWRTLVGGSRQYVGKIADKLGDSVMLNAPVKAVRPNGVKVEVETHSGHCDLYDHVIMACHADQSLRILQDWVKPDLAVLLRSFAYQRNRAILHRDRALMPRRKAAWSSWNYLRSTNSQEPEELCVTYWMNNLQGIEAKDDYFVTLNPVQEPEDGSILRSFLYDHPLFTRQTRRAQKTLWHHQGQQGIWFAGAYLGHGFHEDGLQSGLAVAEALSGRPRPWIVETPSGRLDLPPDWPLRFPVQQKEAAE